MDPFQDDIICHTFTNLFLLHQVEVSTLLYICIYIVTLHFHMLQLILLNLFSLTFCIYLFITLSVYVLFCVFTDLGPY